MTPIEETQIYKRIKDQVQIKLDLKVSDRFGYISSDVCSRFVQPFPMDDIGDQVAMKNHVNAFAEMAVRNILEQCGVTYEDYQRLLGCGDLEGKGSS